MLIHRRVSASSISLDAMAELSIFGFVTLELSTEDTETVRDVPSYSVASFVSDIGGNLGMFFGFSLLRRQFSKERVGLSKW